MHIIIEGGKDRFILELDNGKPKTYQLTKTKSKELLTLLRENERQVVGALFVADFESRKASEIAKELGIEQTRVPMLAFHIREGRKMSRPNKQWHLTMHVCAGFAHDRNACIHDPLATICTRVCARLQQGFAS
jgi:hypothetical protein